MPFAKQVAQVIAQEFRKTCFGTRLSLFLFTHFMTSTLASTGRCILEAMLTGSSKDNFQSTSVLLFFFRVPDNCGSPKQLRLSREALLAC